MHRGLRLTTNPAVFPRYDLSLTGSNAWLDVFDALIKLKYIEDLLFMAEILNSLESRGLKQIF
jgi:hypothetical protein